MFAIEPQRILDDIRWAQDDFPAVANELAALRAIPFQARTPEIDAMRAHLRMIEAHELSRRDNIAAEVQTFYSALGASYVAEEAQMVSMNQGRCAELFSAIQAIRRREGFSEDNGWLADEGPADYRRLNDELGQFLEKIYDTVFVSVLRRYQLEYYADLSSAIGRNSNFSGRLAVE